MRGVRASTGGQGSTGLWARRARAPRYWAALLVACTLVPACGRRVEGPARQQELETIEVPGAIDAGISLAEDVEGKAVVPRKTGVVPSDFPSDFPIYSPSAVVDFGPGFVDLTSTDPSGAVERGIAAAARAAGWQGTGGGWSKGGRRVAVSLGSISGVTTIRLTYS